MAWWTNGRRSRVLQAKAHVWFQTLLMEIPSIPSRSWFQCRTGGPLVPPPLLLLGKKGMAGNCWAFCVMPPLRMEHSDFVPFEGRCHLSLKWAMGPQQCPPLALSFVVSVFYWHASPWLSFILPAKLIFWFLLFFVGVVVVVIISTLLFHLFVPFGGHAEVFCEQI